MGCKLHLKSGRLLLSVHGWTQMWIRLLDGRLLLPLVLGCPLNLLWKLQSNRVPLVLGGPVLHYAQWILMPHVWIIAWRVFVLDAWLISGMVHLMIPVVIILRFTLWQVQIFLIVRFIIISRFWVCLLFLGFNHFIRIKWNILTKPF